MSYAPEWMSGNITNESLAKESLQRVIAATEQQLEV